MTTAAVVLLLLLFLTRPLSYLPNAVLAAIVFLIGVGLVDLCGLAEIRRCDLREFPYGQNIQMRSLQRLPLRYSA